MSTLGLDDVKGPVVVGGIKAADPANPPPRLELRDMKKNHLRKWQLYLLGLEQFKKTKENENHPLSYFRIAGIHGRPYKRWPENNTVLPDKSANGRGFCTHTSILFLTWHRPYLALFEAELYKHVNRVAQQFKDKEYLEAAKDFRMPYWDWALPAKVAPSMIPPECMITEKPNVKRPDGTTLDYNPLAYYDFGSEGLNDPKINYATTRTFRAKDYQGDETQASKELEKSFVDDDISKKRTLKGAQEGNPILKGRNLTERTLFLLQSYSSFKFASNNALPLNPNEQAWYSWGSLEDTHNAVHGYTGSGGQMGNPAVAAFDPIFWLHHANIDRLFAIWQALHPEKTDANYVVEMESEEGTYTTKKGDHENKLTPLTPFNRTAKATDFWNSDQVRDTKTFGYVYPETLAKHSSVAEVRSAIQQLYSDGSLTATATVSVKRGVPEAAFEDDFVSQLSKRAKLIQEVAKTDLTTPMLLTNSVPANVEAQIAKLPDLPVQRHLSDLIKHGKYLEWLVDLKAEKHANDGDFVVHVFLGDPEDGRPQDYELNTSHVASFYPFSQPASTECAKCQVDQAARIQITGQIPLTMALVERYLAGQVGGLDVQNVVDYLKVDLHWRVTSTRGVGLDRDGIPGLLVGVVSNEVTLPTDGSGVPRYSEVVTPHPEATTKANSREGRGDGTGFVGGQISVV